MSAGLNASRKLKPSASPRPLPWPQALGLAALVTLVHLWLLDLGTPTLALHPAQPAAQTLSFHTRQVQAVPPASPPAPPTAPARAAAVRAPQPHEPAASAAPAPAVAAAPASGDTPAAAAAPSRAQASATPQAPAAPEPAAPPAREAAAQAATAPQLPGSARLRYALSGQARSLPYSAEGELFWQHDGQRYEARMTLSGLLLARPRILSSVGELGPEGVVPRRFSDRSRSEQATHFQPERGRIVFSSNAPEAPWQPGAQDRVSLFFQLAGLLAAEPARYTPGVQLRLWTAGTREADAWTFTVTGKPSLSLPLGELATVALRREPRREHDQTIEIWLAPSLGYLPARIRITQGNGDVVDQRLAAVEPL